MLTSNLARKHQKYYLIIIAILCITPTYAQIDWYKTFNNIYPNEHPTVPNLGWSESYTMRAYLSMYRAAVARGEPHNEQLKWLTWLADHCSYVINSNLKGEEALVLAGHGYTPIAKFIKMVFKDANLYSIYGDTANAYLNYIETVIIPHWRDYPNCWKEPFNWYLAYGSLLLNLHQITRNKYYYAPYYQTPDTSLANYYYQSLKNITEYLFQDFSSWTYTGPGWQWNSMQFPYKGLCYVPPPTDAYIWRYMDEGDYLTFYDWNNQHHAQGAQITEPIGTNEWYYIKIQRQNDSIRLNLYDSTGFNLLLSSSGVWDSLLMVSSSDMYIGRQPNSPYSAYFEGILDEIRIYKNNHLIAWWPFEGNVNDRSGNGHNGTINGSPSWVLGKIGKALEFHHDYVLIPDNPELNHFDKIELWVKFFNTSPKYYNYILGKSDSFPGSSGYNLYVYAYRRPEDVGHANIDIEFLTEIACDSVFSSAYSNQQLQRFANTFINILWSNNNVSNPTFRGWVDPTAKDYDHHIFRWLWLYKYNSLIGSLVSNWYENHPSYWFEEPLADLACWQAGLFVDDCNEYTTHIPHINNKAKNLSIYPNPSSDYIVLDIGPAINQDLTLNIYNILGKLISTVSFRQRYLQIYTGGLKNGIYIVEIKSKEWSIRQKLMIRK